MQPCNYLAFILALPLALLLSCSSPQSPDEEIADYLSTAEKYFEKKDAGALKKLIADGYKDERNLSRQEIHRILAGYFFRRPNTYVQLNALNPLFAEDNVVADITVYAAISSEPLAPTDVKILGSEFYRLDATLKKNGEWLLTSAILRRISADDYISSHN